MKPNSLNKTGLSMSQAQSVSNLMNQRAEDINSIFKTINNTHKVVIIDGKEYVETRGNRIPENINELVMEKAKLHACQAFLMENIKAKTELLKSINNKTYQVDYDSAPQEYETVYPTDIPQVGEEWGWSQLSVNEYNEYLEAEAIASAHGNFIHKNSPLDNLRKELPKLKTLEWIEVEKDKKTPLVVDIIHTQDELLAIHNELAVIHRVNEQRVNYYKAKVKNLVTLENARIAKENSDNQSMTSIMNENARTKYELAHGMWRDAQEKNRLEFEIARQNEIKEVSEYRILVDPRFKDLIDKFLVVE